MVAPADAASLSGRAPVQRVAYLRDQCRGRKVLHLGCSNWPYTADSLREGRLLHAQLAADATELWGVDSEPEALEMLRQAGYDHLVEADLEGLGNAPVLRDAAPFDVVVAGEVLEHLANPGELLAGLPNLLAGDGTLLVTVPNAYCAFRFAAFALRGKGGRNEVVHPDHVAYYSPATLRYLLHDQGFEVDEVGFYDIGTEHRPHAPWHWKIVNDVAVRLAPQLADGVVARSHPRSSP